MTLKELKKEFKTAKTLGDIRHSVFNIIGNTEDWNENGNESQLFEHNSWTFINFDRKDNSMPSGYAEYNVSFNFSELDEVKKVTIKMHNLYNVMDDIDNLKVKNVEVERL